jgi:Restriction endonuclease
MLEVQEFVVGNTYSNDQIRFTLGVSNLGGIRPSLDADGSLRHIVLMTTEAGKQVHQDNPYRDRIEGDVLVFTGSGRKGHQELSGSNKRILEQFTAPVPIFGFQNQGQQLYRFLGLLELLRNYTESQVDSARSLRDVWLFEFKIHIRPSIVPVSLARRIIQDILEASAIRKQLDDSEKVVAVPSPEPTGQEQQISGSVIESEEIRAKLLEIQPYRFEHLIKCVLERSGFLNVEVTKASGDGGIDLNAVVGDSHYFFSGTFVQVQAKRWRHAVGSVEINNFRGAMSSSAKGIFISTSHYTRAAVDNAAHPQKLGVTLIEGRRLAEIILKNRIDVTGYFGNA